MSKPPIVIVVVLGCVTLLASPALAAKKKPKTGTEPSPLTAEQVETNYTQTIEKRAGDILAVLDLKEEAKARRVHDVIVEQYRALRDWQANTEGKLNEPSERKGHGAGEQTNQPTATRRLLHEKFVAKLSAELTPEQVEKVKDKMTYNKLKVTYDGYCEIVPGLTEKDKAKVLALLKEAREEAMDGVSAEEKSAIFKRYKGKINIYLSAEGYDVAKAYKEWGTKMKDKAAAGSRPSTEPAK